MAEGLNNHPEKENTGERIEKTGAEERLELFTKFLSEYIPAQVAEQNRKFAKFAKNTSGLGADLSVVGSITVPAQLARGKTFWDKEIEGREKIAYLLFSASKILTSGVYNALVFREAFFSLSELAENSDIGISDELKNNPGIYLTLYFSTLVWQGTYLAYLYKSNPDLILKAAERSDKIKKVVQLIDSMGQAGDILAKTFSMAKKLPPEFLQKIHKKLFGKDKDE